MTNEDDLPAAALAVPGCLGCARLLKRIEKLELRLAKMETLEARVQELEELVRQLTARLNQNSTNSSKPPSSDPPGTPGAPPKERSGRKPGGQPGHEGHRRPRLPKERVTRIVHHLPEQCAACGNKLPQELSDPPGHEPSWHQVTEVPPFAAEVTEHQGHACACKKCGHITHAEIPPDIRADAIGPNLAAILSFLSGRCHESKRTVQEVAESLFGVGISLGTISNLEREMQAALAPAYEEAKAVVIEAPSKNVDETGWYQKSGLKWLWVGATKIAVCFQIHAKRGRDGLEAFLGDVVKGIVNSDRWGAYARLPLKARQICWSHLKRDFQKLIDSGNAKALKLGTAGLKVVKELFEIWHDFKAGKFGRRALKRRMVPVKARLKRALISARDGPDPTTARFSRRILKIWRALWTFVEHEDVEPTNNHAERMLRPAVLWRKRSFGNQSEDGCRFTERMLTVVQTLRLQDRPVLDHLRKTIIAHRNGSTPPALLRTAEG